MTIHSPDDELDERWKALHEHPGLGQVPNFDALDLPGKSHANDPKPQPVQPKRVHQRPTASDDPQEDSSDEGAGGLFDDGPHETLDEAVGHDLIHQEYQNWLSRPRVIEVDDYPL